MYVGAILAITIAPAAISSFNNPNAQKFNLIPLINTYKQYVDTLAASNGISTRFALENIIGNFILFIPLGIFLPAIFKQLGSLMQVAIVCFLFSFAIELLQCILRKFGIYRTTDIDDVILNTLGGIIGWLIFYAATFRRKKQLPN
jgi:glycopeptide antibiotics resistance protein